MIPSPQTGQATGNTARLARFHRAGISEFKLNFGKCVINDIGELECCMSTGVKPPEGEAWEG
jgi:hypothetical protein